MCIISNRDESFLFIFAEFRLPVHQVTIGISVLAPYSSSELMETRESELLRINDDDGIRREEVDPILDDGGREEDIVFSFFECMNSVFYLVPWHLTMSDDYLRNF